jgi:hypothetical protein
MATTRAREAQPLPPLSRAHQEGLHAIIKRCQALGQDTTLLTQLADSLPGLRAGLSASERQRIEELDANERVLMMALETVRTSIEIFDSFIESADEAHTLARLVDGAFLYRLSEISQTLAEAASDCAMRASAHAVLID